MAFVLGNEGQGVCQAVLDACDHTLYIPIQGIESFKCCDCWSYCYVSFS